MKRRRPKYTKDQKKAAKLDKLISKQRAVENLSLVIGQQAMPLDAGPEAMERDPAEFYPASKRFDQLPLSEPTKQALKDAGFETLTAVQRAAIPHALLGRNVIGTAKTGSGKTLTFLVPLIERLYREHWSEVNGVGAIVVSPTRELAMQTFDQLRLVSKHHHFEGGLLIGKGMDLEAERADLSRYAIVVATPGRLLQHLDEATDFNTTDLQMIIFDECDRLLDLGFAHTIDAILGHLPPVRSGETHELQCMMLSATNNQTLVSQRISQAQFVDVDPHRHSKSATPNALKHFAMEVPLDEKMAVLWSFVKQHLFAKIMVFVASCKQARFLEEVFRRLAVSPVWCGAIHGRLPQPRRMAKYYEFRDVKSGILICTDVAARGLDFPAVDWVIQMDMPDDTDCYIHRVGRTARLGGQGSALLFVMPSENAFLNKLARKGIIVENVVPDKKKVKDPSGEIQSVVSSDNELKYAAQKAFICYMRSVYLAHDKEVFDITDLPYKGFSQSLGLITVPKIKFGKSKRVDKNTPYSMRDAMAAADAIDSDDSDEEAGGSDDEHERDKAENAGSRGKRSKPPKSRIDKLMNRGTQHRVTLRDDEDDEDDDNLFELKREDHELENVLSDDDNDGNEGDSGGVRKKRFMVDPEALSTNWEAKAEEHATRLHEMVSGADKQDRKTAKERRKERRMLAKQERKEKAKLRKQARAESMADDAHDANDDASSSFEEDTRPNASEMSVAEREALALKMLEDF